MVGEPIPNWPGEHHHSTIPFDGHDDDDDDDDGDDGRTHHGCVDWFS